MDAAASTGGMRSSLGYDHDEVAMVAAPRGAGATSARVAVPDTSQGAGNRAGTGRRWTASCALTYRPRVAFGSTGLERTSARISSP